MKELLRIEHLKKYFPLPSGKVLKAVDDVSFSIEENQIVGVIGESGCGKTTLARMIAGAETPTEGKIFFEDRQIGGTRRDKELSRSIHLIFQDADGALNPRMTVQESLEEALALSKRTKNEEVISKLLRSVGLEKRYKDAYPAEISGGQRQRVAIARCLAVRPKLLIADEPIASLDVSIQAQIINLLLDLQKKEKFSILFIGHDLAVVHHISDKIIVMYHGVIVEMGNTEDIFSHPVHGYTKLLLSSILRPDSEKERKKENVWANHGNISTEGTLKHLSPTHQARMTE